MMEGEDSCRLLSVVTMTALAEILVERNLDG